MQGIKQLVTAAIHAVLAPELPLFLHRGHAPYSCYQSIITHSGNSIVLHIQNLHNQGTYVSGTSGSVQSSVANWLMSRSSVVRRRNLSPRLYPRAAFFLKSWAAVGSKHAVLGTLTCATHLPGLGPVVQQSNNVGGWHLSLFLRHSSLELVHKRSKRPGLCIQACIGMRFALKGNAWHFGLLCPVSPHHRLCNVNVLTEESHVVSTCHVN